jgi:hypothetical protein
MIESSIIVLVLLACLDCIRIGTVVCLTAMHVGLVAVANFTAIKKNEMKRNVGSAYY